MKQRYSRHDVGNEEPTDDPTPPSAEAAPPPPTTTRPLEPWGKDFAAAFGSILRSSIDSESQPQEQPSQKNINQLVEDKLVRPFLYRWKNDDSSSQQRTTAAAVKELLKHQSILQSMASLLLMQTKSQPASTNGTAKEEDLSSSLQLIHSVQLQVCLRLALWRWAGDQFVKKYNKQNLGRNKKNKKKKAHSSTKKKELQDHPEALLLNDILGLLQLALVKIGTEVEVMQFLQQCLRKEDCEALPAITQQIWEFFEKPNPYEQEQDQQQPDGDAVDRLLSLDLSPPAKKKKKRVAPPPPPTNKENQQLPAPDKKQPKSDALLPTKVSLTAATHPRRRPNRLLGGNDARSFVGSHFNSSLSNAVSLFRQVPAARSSSNLNAAISKTKGQQQPQHNIKKRSHQQQRETGRMAPPRKRIPATGTAAASKRTAPNHEFVVPATPLACHKKRRNYSSSTTTNAPPRSLVPETPSQPRAAVPETPQPQPGMALVVTARPAAPKNMPPPASLVVAEALSSLAVQKARREERRRKSMLLG